MSDSSSSPAAAVPHDRLDALVAWYRNTAEANDGVHRTLTDATWSDPILAEHRRHIEVNQLGFGDPAFHAMWKLLLEAAGRRFGPVRVLEIGVYKGQVISLWALLAKHLGLDAEIHALTPLAGEPRPRESWWNRLRRKWDRRWREKFVTGNFYETADYPQIVRTVFSRFGCDFDRVVLHRGFSTDPAILASLASASFHIVYVDGDHTYAGAKHDFLQFGPKVVPGGWLVADDSGADLPGSGFWKGYPETTAAAGLIPGLGFRNVLNVGHNRVFERLT